MLAYRGMDSFLLLSQDEEGLHPANGVDFGTTPGGLNTPEGR